MFVRYKKKSYTFGLEDNTDNDIEPTWNNRGLSFLHKSLKKPYLDENILVVLTLV